MPDTTTHVFGSHLLLEEERRRFRNTVDQLEKQRAEAQEEVDELINALRRERDLGDEEIIFLKAQLRGITATKYETEDKVENLEKENENLKEELKKETYKRKKLKERFLELQDLVNDESVVLVKEVEKRDEEIQTLKDDIADLKDQIAGTEEERDVAKDKEEQLLEECERLASAVDDLEDQLKAAQRDITAYRIVLEEKGVNTEKDVEDDAVVQAKTDLEEVKREKAALEEQLTEVKEALEEGEKELLESLEEKDKKIGQLKRALEDNEYLHQTKEDDLYLENEKLNEALENLQEQMKSVSASGELPPEMGVSQEKYDQLLGEVEKMDKERLKLQNHYKDLKSYIDKDTADLIAEVQERDAVIESMNAKLEDLDALEQLHAELDWTKKQRKVDEQRIAELRNAIPQDKKEIVADSERKSDMIRQLKATLTDAKTNLERARYKQREIIAANQQLRADNQALQRELDEAREREGSGPRRDSTDKKVEELIEELKDSNRDLAKEREMRGQLHSAMQTLKETLGDDEADLVDEIQKRDIIIANLHCQLQEETDRLKQQVENHRKREAEVLDDYQTLKDRVENVERDCEPIGHQPAIKELERDMFEDLSHWLEDEVRILETGLSDRVCHLSELESLLRNDPNFDEERIHYVKELAAQEKEINELRSLNRAIERGQRDRSDEYQKELDKLMAENEALRRQLGGNIVSAPIDGSTDSIPVAIMSQCPMDESGLGVSIGVDSMELQRATPPGQAAPSPHPQSEVPAEKHDDSKERELIAQLRQIYSNLDMCRQDINRIVENFHDRIVRHHPRLQRRDSPTRLDARNIGQTINSLLEGYHSQVTDLINRLNGESATIARRNESLEDVVQQLEANLGQERTRYDQLHARCKSYRQEIQDLRARLKQGNVPAPAPMEGNHANHDLCEAVHELLNDLDSGPSSADGRGRAPSIQEISRLLLPQVEQAAAPTAFATPDGAAFKEDCDVIQEKTDELTDLVKGLHSRLDAQKQAKIDALQEKVKEYEKEMDRLRDLIGDESEKEAELEALRERNRQLALNLRDSQAELEGAERKNSVLTDKFKEANDALNSAVDELGDLRRKTREREAYIRQLQEQLRRADERIEEKDQSNEHLRNNCDELQEKAQQLSSLIKEVESKFVEKSRQYTLLEQEFNKLQDDHRVIAEFCDKKNAKIGELETDLRDLIAENQKLVDENAELTDEGNVKDERIKELEHRLDAKERLIDELEKAASTMADDIGERDSVLKQMNEEVEKLEAAAEEKDALLKQLEDDLDQQDKELTKQDQEIEDLKADLKDKEEEVKALEDAKKALEDENKKLKEQVEELKEDLETAREDVEKLERAVEEKEGEVEKLKDLVSDLEKDLKDAEEEVDGLKDELDTLARECDDKQEELEKAADALEKAEKEDQEKQETLDKQTEEIDRLRDEIQDLENLAPEVEALKEDGEKLREYIEDLEETLKEEQDKLDKLEDSNKDLEQEKNELKDKVTDQTADLEQLAEIVTDLETDVEQADKENQKLRDENDDLKKELGDLAQQKQDILDEVKDAMDDIDGERENYKDTLEQLKGFLENQKKDLDELKSQVKEKPELEHRCMQTDVQESRSVRQQTDEIEVTNVRIQTVIEDMKPPLTSRRIQTDVDPMMAAKATARTEIKKSSSLHILRNLINTIDRPTQTEFS